VDAPAYGGPGADGSTQRRIGLVHHLDSAKVFRPATFGRGGSQLLAVPRRGPHAVQWTHGSTGQEKRMMRTIGRTASASTRGSAGVVAATIVVALAIWALARMLGVELTVGKGQDASTVGPVDVLVTALLAGLAAWGVHALLVRRGAARWWPFVGSTALAISVVGPNWLADGVAAVVLIAMHLAVGAVLIAGLAGVRWSRSPQRG